MGSQQQLVDGLVAGAYRSKHQSISRPTAASFGDGRDGDGGNCHRRYCYFGNGDGGNGDSGHCHGRFGYCGNLHGGNFDRGR